MRSAVHSPDAVQSAPPTPGSHTTWTRLFLEDDHDLWRMIVVSFGSTRLSQAVSQKLGFVVTVAVFLFVMGLLMQVADSQEATSDYGVRSEDEFGLVSAELDTWNLAEPWLALAYQHSDLTPFIGSVTSDPDYTFGSIDEETALADAIATSQSGGIGLLALNNAFASGGGRAGGFGGGAPGSKSSVAAAQETPAHVPETVSPALLLSLALVSVLGLHFLVRQRSARIHRSR